MLEVSLCKGLIGVSVQAIEISCTADWAYHISVENCMSSLWPTDRSNVRSCVPTTEMITLILSPESLPGI